MPSWPFASANHFPHMHVEILICLSRSVPYMYLQVYKAAWMPRSPSRGAAIIVVVRSVITKETIHMPSRGWTNHTCFRNNQPRQSPYSQGSCICSTSCCDHMGLSHFTISEFFWFPFYFFVSYQLCHVQNNDQLHICFHENMWIVKNLETKLHITQITL